MESTDHRRLKQLAAAFLRDHGCTAIAAEVTCPFARFRIDVAGWADRPARAPRPPGADGPPRDRGPRRSRTIMIECKRSRGDFLRDARNLERLQAQRQALDRLRMALEERLRTSGEAGICRGERSLFGAMESWDFSRARHPGYRDLLRRLARLDRRIHGETKFLVAARYRLADRLYLAAPAGLLRPRDLPAGWGLLEASPGDLAGAGSDVARDLFGGSRLSVRVRAPELGVAREGYRDRLLRNIAVAASRDAMRALAADVEAAARPRSASRSVGGRGGEDRRGCVGESPADSGHGSAFEPVSERGSAFVGARTTGPRRSR